jgi:hypothetical protein
VTDDDRVFKALADPTRRYLLDTDHARRQRDPVPWAGFLSRSWATGVNHGNYLVASGD